MHVCVVRSQPTFATTSAGAGVSMWPGASTVAGTRWQVAHAIGVEMRERRWRWCAPTPIAVVNMLPARSIGGAGESALP